MKKSNTILLSVVLLTAIESCRQKDEWIVGNQGGTTQDTTMHGNRYRFYGGYWYPIINGLISPRSYNGASISDISRPGFTSTRVRTGGFGSFSRTSAS